MSELLKVTAIMLSLDLDLWNENLHVTYEIISANSSMSWFSLTLLTLSEKVKLPVLIKKYQLHEKTKTQISCAVTAHLISALGFATEIVKFLPF